MTKPLRELIGDAASDCPSVHISGDVYELGDFIVAALAAAGLKVVGREPTEEMVMAMHDGPLNAWDHAPPSANTVAWLKQMFAAAFDAAPPATKENESE